MLTALELPAGAEVLGPVVVPPAGSAGRRSTTAGRGAGPAEPESRVVVRVPRAAGAALSRALLEVQGVRAARKQPAVRVQVDPWSLG